MIIRDATPEDAAAVAAIYAHHVVHGTGSFEASPPSCEQMRERMATVADRGLPWLVAEADGRVVGYAYIGVYRPREGYRWTAEDTVYVAPGDEGRGVGAALLGEALDRVRSLGIRQVIAVVGDSGNSASIALHRRFGFEIRGVLEMVGFKHGRWLDSVVMQLTLDPSDEAPQAGTGWR